MTYTGRCACGAATAQIAGEPVATRESWCRQCQQASAGSAARNATFLIDDFHLVGPTATHRYTAASGNTVAQHFCSICGTPLYAESSARPQFRTVRFGFLDPGHGLRPTMSIWTSEAPDWAVIDPALERFDHQPPLPVKQD